MADQNFEIFSVDKNPWTKIIVSVASYKGSVYVDIREKLKPKGENEFKFTQKGVTIKDVDQLVAMAKCIVASENTIRSKMEEMSKDTKI